MYSTSNVRKFLNASNTLLLESNQQTIDRFVEVLLEKVNDIDTDLLDQVVFSVKDELSNEHITNVLQKKKKRNAVKRPPTQYNLFIKEHMNTLKTNNPELKNKELMIEAAALWNQHKAEKLQNEKLQNKK